MVCQRASTMKVRVSNMRICPTLFPPLLVLVLVVGVACDLRKCCPLSERLNSTLDCVLPTSEAPWRFPIDNVTVIGGVTPPCADHEMDVLEGDSFSVVHDASGSVRLQINSSLVALGWGRFSLPDFDFCVDLLEDEGEDGRLEVRSAALVCPCRVAHCIRKCCLSGELLHMPEAKCTPPMESADEGKGHWAPQIKAGHNSTALYLLMDSLPLCNGTTYQLVYSHTMVYGNGSIQGSDTDHLVPVNKYCGEHTPDGTHLLVVCEDALPPPLKADSLWYVLYGAGMLVSAVLLLLTVLVQVLTHGTSTVHGRLLLAHNLCLLVGFVFLSVIQLGLNQPAHGVCVFLAFAMHFCFLTSFFWLNTMCFDIAWAFSGVRPPQGSAASRDRCKCVSYCLYALGGPVTVSVVMAVMEWVPGVAVGAIRPHFGVRACWFRDRDATVAYFYGPMGLLLLINLFLFVYTAARILWVRRTTGVLQTGDSGRHVGRHVGSNRRRDKLRLLLYAKLFCIMGVTWCTEVVSWAISSTADGTQYLWYVTDTINLLRALLIFVNLCCKRAVLRQLRMRLAIWGLCPLLPPRTTGATTATARSSGLTQHSSLHMVGLRAAGAHHQPPADAADHRPPTDSTDRQTDGKHH